MVDKKYPDNAIHKASTTERVEWLTKVAAEHALSPHQVVEALKEKLKSAKGEAKHDLEVSLFVARRCYHTYIESKRAAAPKRVSRKSRKGETVERKSDDIATLLRKSLG